jgi:PAS domain S-box-containing protein
VKRTRIQGPESAGAEEAGLRRRAEARLREWAGTRRPRPLAGVPESDADARRLLHELQVHQLELEMQNAELREARDRGETLLERYTELYDFAPVGYFSLDEEGRILEVNLTGAALLGVERSRLLHRRLSRFVAPTSQPAFRSFLERTLAGEGKQVGEATLRREDGQGFWANFHGVLAAPPAGGGKGCRVAVSDITSLKQAEEAQRRLEALGLANRQLQREIVRREEVAAALTQSERYQTRLLEQSRRLQEQQRRLSHGILQAQEEERRRISRELHDEIVQTLVGISVHLAGLSREAADSPARLRRQIARTQRLVEKSVAVVHQFARELRPSLLDDLGLMAALEALAKTFLAQNGLRVGLSASGEVEQLDADRRTVLYRVVHAALANVARHARASRVEVTLRKRADRVELEVTDDGRGFDVDQMLTARHNLHLGLLGMRERVEMVGGVFAVESAPGRGTTIRAQVPFRRKASPPGQGDFRTNRNRPAKPSRALKR